MPKHLKSPAARRFGTDLLALTLLLFGGLCVASPAFAGRGHGVSSWLVSGGGSSKAFIIEEEEEIDCAYTQTSTCTFDSTNNVCDDSGAHCSDNGKCACQEIDYGTTRACTCQQ